MIASAAVKVKIVKDHKISSFIFPCHRHADVPYIFHKLKVPYGIVEEGFLTDDGEFLDRYDAAAHVYECGQLIETMEEPKITCLFSEDLW